MKLGPLFRKDAKGKVRVWQGECCPHPEHPDWAITTIQTGIDGGALVGHHRTTKKGTNVGRSNERSPVEQAYFELQARYDHKIDREGYVKDRADLEKARQVILPMLASPWAKHAKNRVYPSYAQPKLDGVRCLAYLSEEQGTVQLKSRKNKAFVGFSAIENQLYELFKSTPSCILDGELYNHDIGFDQITGTVRNEKDWSGKNDLYYAVFDCYFTDDPGQAFEDRWRFLERKFGENPLVSVLLVSTIRVEDENEFLAHSELWLNQGYEGAIWRNPSSPYEVNKRSHSLQKYKKFIDCEFTIVGHREATGNDRGTVIWECVNDSGKKFTVRPEGTREERKTYLTRAPDYYGCRLTVRYQELTKDNVPRFPVGVCIRNYE